MKLFMISDIHGSAEWLKRALDLFEQEQPDQLLLLGDLLYHGPRNPLPDGYDPEAVAQLLNQYKDKIIAVRGNCDAEVDQLLIEFPIMADYAMLYYEGRRIFMTHGHLSSMDELPPLSPGDLFIQGHTHLPVAESRDDIIVINPGSISLPKGNNPNSYAIIEGTDVRILDFDGNVLKQMEIS